MYLAYRWARARYQKRRREHNEAPPGPPTNSIEFPLQRSSGPGYAVAPETSTSFEAPSTTSANGNRPTTTTKEPKPKPKPEKSELTPEEKADKRRRRIYRWKIVIGLFAPFLLQSLDTTIIASALPFIAKDFSKPPFSFPQAPIPPPPDPQSQRCHKPLTTPQTSSPN